MLRKRLRRGIDGQSWSAIAIDRNGHVLTNTPIWMDTRAQSVCDRLNEEIGAEAIFEVAGTPFSHLILQRRSSGIKKTFRRCMPKLTKSFSPTSFIAFKLTGAVSQDLSQGYGLHCFDMRTGKWNEAMCEKLGIPVEFLPKSFPVTMLWEQ